MLGLLAFLFLILNHPGEWIMLFFERILALEPAVLFFFIVLLFFHHLTPLLESELEVHTVIVYFFVAD